MCEDRRAAIGSRTVRPAKSECRCPNVGYEKPAQIALKPYREKIRLKEAALGLGFVTKASRQMGFSRRT